MSEKTTEISAASCDGRCDDCPIDATCDHVRLTESQKFSAAVCGCCFLLLATGLVVASVFAAVKSLMEVLR